ncbi:hypothetical protein DYB31_011265 [Aphanomyces astaci]|uniref:RING-type E3 ubiquitin transferase n=1 Tax=Aphanomyces astaci TaxID=112090 RepID=A0A397FZ73_APHAT|nr:hypothetical protein DYB31_011265 [Aphanomyces astaci]
MRFGIYATTSLLAGAGLVGYTYYTRQQFYPTVIYLVTSKVSVMVLCNVAFVMTVLFGQVFKRIFLGTLRDAELEFLILFVTLVAVFLRYILHLIDARVEGTWTNKFTYVFYLELVTEIVKLIVYLIFFMIIFTYYGMPLHLLRDLWMSIQNLQRRIVTYFRYRRITANMNERFPSPTEDEMNETDRICIICREEMTLDSSKKLPCSHIFHLNCLRMWLQRQQVRLISSLLASISYNSLVDVSNLPLQHPRGRDPPAPRWFGQPLQPAAAPVMQPIPPPPQQQPAPPQQPGATPTPGAAVHQGAPQFPPPSHHPGVPPPQSFPSTNAPAEFTGLDPSIAHYMQSLHYGLQLDPRFLQYQLDMLQAQLHVLRATSLALQSQPGLNHVPSFPGAFGTPPVGVNQQPPIPNTAAPSPLPTPPVATPATLPPAASSAPVTRESSTTPLPQVATPAVDDDPPASPQEPVNVPSEETPAIPLTPEEIERDRRREALRRIYAKRYGGASEAAVDEE